MDKNNNEQLNTRVASDAVVQNKADEILKNDDTNSYEFTKAVPDDVATKVEKTVNNDLDVIRSLMEVGLVSRQQGQNLMTEVIENAYKSITTTGDEQVNSPNSTEAEPQKDYFAEFLMSKPDFFNGKGREDVLTYLKNSPVKFDKDELFQISELIESLEKSAVDRYLQKLEYGKTLNDENRMAKQRLTANAQNSNANDNNMVFTRAQIGKMSGDEFAKYESLIMDQMRKGLIH